MKKSLISGVIAAFAAVAAADGLAPRPENVPQLMKTFAGGSVGSVADWERVRAPEILERYRNEVFGVRPKALEEKRRVSFEVTDVRDAMGGKAVRKLVKAKFDGPEGVFTFPFTVFIPKSERPVPAFVFICNRPRSNVDPDRSIRSAFWPAEEIVFRGYATAAFLFSDVAADDRKAGYGQGVFPSVEKMELRGKSSWASISAWAWAASRVMDWMETEPLIDATMDLPVVQGAGGEAEALILDLNALDRASTGMAQTSDDVDSLGEDFVSQIMALDFSTA
jgi:hypothetical protein